MFETGDQEMGMGVAGGRPGWNPGFVAFWLWDPWAGDLVLLSLFLDP